MSVLGIIATHAGHFIAGEEIVTDKDGHITTHSALPFLAGHRRDRSPVDCEDLVIDFDARFGGAFVCWHTAHEEATVRPFAQKGADGPGRRRRAAKAREDEEEEEGPRRKEE